MTTKAQVQGLGEFAQWGFTLEHPGDHVLFLMHDGRRIATFSQLGATPESIQKECARHLTLYHHWNGCL
ncbi:hypothetical protein ES703_09380 [subsurface metagenome]